MYDAEGGFQYMHFLFIIFYIIYDIFKTAAHVGGRKGRAITPGSCQGGGGRVSVA